MRRPNFTPAQRLKCFEDHGAIVLCQGEGCDSAIHIKGCPIDHWLALIDGGTHEQSNFRPLCGSCHKRKSAREHIENWRAKRRHAKHFGNVKAMRKGRDWPPAQPLRGRAFPKCSRKLQSRGFQKAEGRT